MIRGSNGDRICTNSRTALVCGLQRLGRAQCSCLPRFEADLQQFAAANATLDQFRIAALLGASSGRSNRLTMPCERNARSSR